MKLENVHGQFRDFMEIIEGKITTTETSYQALLLYFLSKGWKTFQSIFVLCKNGFEEDARILLRSLLELAVNLRYIAKDESARTLLFCEYSYIEKKRFADILKEFAKEHPDDPSIKNILASKTWEQSGEELKEFQRIKKKYPDKRFWSGESLKMMAKKVGMHLHYVLYTMFCRVSHPSSEGVNNYLTVQNGKLTCGGDCSLEDIERTWWTTCVYFLLVLKELDRSFSLNLAIELTAIDRQLREMAPHNGASPTLS